MRALVFLLLQACAYQLLPSEAPFAARRIVVVPFGEDVAVGLSGDLTQALTAHLASGGVQVVLDPAAADAVLQGRVVSVVSAGSPTSVGGVVPMYRLTATIEAKLISPTSETLWTSTVTVGEDFLASAATNAHQLLGTEANRRSAIFRLAQTAAQQIHQRLLLASINRKVS